MQVEQFYEEHKSKSFFPQLKKFMTSGPVVALAVGGRDAIAAWRGLCGPTATAKAKAEAPSSLRARFGTDGTKNAVHGSDSVDSAARELGLVLGVEYSALLSKLQQTTQGFQLGSIAALD